MVDPEAQVPTRLFLEQLLLMQVVEVVVVSRRGQTAQVE
jgi:hypothetical protein